MIKIFLLSIVLLFLAFAGFAIKMFFNNKSEFKGLGCTASSPELEKQGISCGCEAKCATGDSPVS